MAVPAPAAPLSIAPYVFPLLVAFAMYRRIRRNFGVQPWRPTRAWFRLVFLSLVSLMLLVAGVLKPQTLPAIGIGLACGAVLGYFGLKHTHVALVGGQRTYTPNPWIGGALSALLVGRLAWRWTHGGIAAAQAAPSGVTFGIAMALITYSLIYIAGLMMQMKHLQAPAAPQSPASNPPTAL
jgi:hypothetical protein